MERTKFEFLVVELSKNRFTLKSIKMKNESKAILVQVTTLLHLPKFRVPRLSQ